MHFCFTVLFTFQVPNGLKLKLNDALPASSIGLNSLKQNNGAYQKILSTEIVFSKQFSKTVWPNISNPPGGSVSASTYTQNAQHVYPPYVCMAVLQLL